jgi:hypothetical protein
MQSILQTDHKNAWRAANSAEGRYLAAVKQQAAPATLAELATDARDHWTAVTTICGLGQDEARWRLEMPPIRHRLQALSLAWRVATEWTALGEDAAARGELFGALASAHVSQPPSHEIIRLSAAGIVEDSFERPVASTTQ